MRIICIQFFQGWMHVLVLLLLIIIPSNETQSKEIKLPILGDSTSGIVSKQQEYQLGRAWLKAFRSRVQEFDDPLMQSYLENLIYNLSTYSELENADIELVIVKNPTMNAFAVPGGVVGVHTGLFSYAENEDQMVSVLAHELAHLSQRHFARGLEAKRASSTLSLAGLLAGLALSATVGGDAGMAAITATQALTMENQLRYSRSNEKEADQFGLRTLRKAGRDPGATADMFETMLKRLRYAGDRPPEFLLTHPVTEKRIADARSRTMNNSMRHYPDHPEYYLMKARAVVAMESNYQNSLKRFNADIEANTMQRDAAHYGLALTHIRMKQFSEAEPLISKLLLENPNQLTFQYTNLELAIALGNYESSISRLQKLINRNPGNYPLMSLQAEALWLDHQYERASSILALLSQQRKEDPKIWYRLAEVRGLAGNISGVHTARAEYFILVGAFGLAREQLTLALKLVKEDFKRSSIIRQRLRDVVDLEERMQKL